jgi:hypothetical protein
LSPAAIGVIVFGATFGAALLGMRLRARLPEHHFTADSRATVQICVGLIATMTALVLGLVTASAKSSFDAVDAAVKHTAVDILALDRVLARYGPETAEIRNGLKQAVAARIDMIWPPDSSGRANLDPLHSGAASRAEGLADAMRRLQPRDDTQRALQSRALDLTEALLQARWVAIAAMGASVPVPFLVVVLLWLAITFGSFGLFAPRNTLVVTVLVVCALSVASAVFLVLEMDGPFDGLLKVSAEPLRYAHAHLNR